jgi:hypothetical protein
LVLPYAHDRNHQSGVGGSVSDEGDDRDNQNLGPFMRLIAEGPDDPSGARGSSCDLHSVEEVPTKLNPGGPGELSNAQKADERHRWDGQNEGCRKRHRQ